MNDYNDDGYEIAWRLDECKSLDELLETLQSLGLDDTAGPLPVYGPAPIYTDDAQSWDATRVLYWDWDHWETMTLDEWIAEMPLSVEKRLIAEGKLPPAGLAPQPSSNGSVRDGPGRSSGRRASNDDGRLVLQLPLGVSMTLDTDGEPVLFLGDVK